MRERDQQDKKWDLSRVAMLIRVRTLQKRGMTPDELEELGDKLVAPGMDVDDYTRMRQDFEEVKTLEEGTIIETEQQP